MSTGRLLSASWRQQRRRQSGHTAVANKLFITPVKQLLRFILIYRRNVGKPSIQQTHTYIFITQLYLLPACRALFDNDGEQFCATAYTLVYSGTVRTSSNILKTR